MANLRSSLKLCLGICAYDGLLSESELDVLFEQFQKRNGLDRELFEQIVDEFFEDYETLEDLYDRASPLTDELTISELAASADGLDLNENLALQKCYFLANRSSSSGDANG